MIKLVQRRGFLLQPVDGADQFAQAAVAHRSDVARTLRSCGAPLLALRKSASKSQLVLTEGL